MPKKANNFQPFEGTHPPYEIPEKNKRNFEKWLKICRKYMPDEPMTCEYEKEKERVDEYSILSNSYIVTFGRDKLTFKDVLTYRIGNSSVSYYNCKPI